MGKVKVLFLCTGNSSRSQMAEAFLKLRGEGRFEVHSAGLFPEPISTAARRVLEEAGVSLKDHRAKSVKIYAGRTLFDYIIPLSKNAESQCFRLFPGQRMLKGWIVDDPDEFEGEDEEITKGFRRVRDQIDSKVRKWLDTQP